MSSLHVSKVFIDYAKKTGWSDIDKGLVESYVFEEKCIVNVRLSISRDKYALFRQTPMSDRQN